MMSSSKMWPPEYQQGFPLIRPGDLVSDIKWPSFKLDPEIIKTNILSNIFDYLKNVTFGVLTKFSADLAWWPSFWSHVTQFQTWPRNHQDKHLEQDLWWLLQKCDRWSVNKIFCWFGLVTLFFAPKWPSFELLSKIHDDCFKNVTARVITRFSADLAQWPSFWSKVTQFQTRSRTHQDKHFEQDSWWWLQKCDR